MTRPAIIINDRVPARASVMENAVALYALQIANYVIPILTLPYLIRVLGAELYGTMAIAYATVFFMVLYIDAGINIRAVRELSRSEISHQRINEIYVATQWVKLGLLIACFMVLVLLISCLPSMQENASLYFASFMLVVGSMLFSTWLFQGLEVMHVTTLCSVGGRMLTTVCLFIFVKGPQDLLLAALLQASATAVSGAMSMSFILCKLKLRLLLPLPVIRDSIQEVMRDARSLWFSEFSTNAVSNSGVFILSIFASDAVVGIYGAIEKLATAAANSFQPLQKALFPKMVKHWRDGESDLTYQKYWTRRLFVLGLLVAAALYILAPLVLGLLFGSSWVIHADLLRIVAIWLLVAVVASTLNQLWLLASGRHSLYSKILTIGAVAQLLLSIFGAALGGATGLFVALLISEIVRMLGSATSLSIYKSGNPL